MDFLAWREAVWPFPAVIGAIEKAAGPYCGHLCILLATCFLALILSRKIGSSGWHLNGGSSSATSQGFAASRGSSSTSSRDCASSGVKGHVLQVNDTTVYELYKPPGTPRLQIVFFHGLPDRDCSDVHLSTWLSRDGSCLWPQTWLAEEFPGAHVLSVSYVEYLKGLDRAYAMESIAETLLEDLILAKVGQVLDCPVALVGHSIGGQFVKQICYCAHEKLNISEGLRRSKLENFLRNMRGIFFYATPHVGIAQVEKLEKYLNIPLKVNFEVLSVGLTYHKFFEMCKVHYDWLLVGLGETLPTKLGDINDVLVPEASARHGTEFSSAEGDHFSICRPRSKTSRSFYELSRFLDRIDEMANDLKLKQLRDRAASRENEEGSSGGRPNMGRLQDIDDDDWHEDPILRDTMCDPVNCSDGRTYDRWTIIDNNLRRSPFDPSMTSFAILCDDITTRSRLFRVFPGQETIFRERRMKYRMEALRNAYADPIEFEEAIEKLNNILKWLPRDIECEKVLATVRSRFSQQGSLLDNIPVVNHKDVTEARLQSEGVRMVVFLGACYFIIMIFVSTEW